MVGGNAGGQRVSHHMGGFTEVVGQPAVHRAAITTSCAAAMLCSCGLPVQHNTMHSTAMSIHHHHYSCRHYSQLGSCDCTHGAAGAVFPMLARPACFATMLQPCNQVPYITGICLYVIVCNNSGACLAAQRLQILRIACASPLCQAEVCVHVSMTEAQE